MNKPLTKERRIEIVALLHKPTAESAEDAWAIGELLEAEAYWRETARDTEPFQMTHQELYICQFCRKTGMDVTKFEHKPDCPWLLAQE